MAYALKLVELANKNEEWSDLPHGTPAERSTKVYDELCKLEEEACQLRIDYIYQKKLNKRDPNEAMDSDFPATPKDPQEIECARASQ